MYDVHLLASNLFGEKIPFSEGRMAACAIILLKVTSFNPFIRKAAENLTIEFSVKITNFCCNAAFHLGALVAMAVLEAPAQLEEVVNHDGGQVGPQLHHHPERSLTLHLHLEEGSRPVGDRHGTIKGRINSRHPAHDSSTRFGRGGTGW